MAHNQPNLSDAAAKQRITSHMNADHSDSLSLYLQHVKKIPAYRIRQAKIIDMDFETMIIQTNSIIPLLSSPQSYKIPVDPPLQTWADARPNLLAMDRSARSALDRSEASVRYYKPPDRSWMYSWLIFVLFVFACFSSRSNFLTGAFVYETFGLKHAGIFARFCYWIFPYYWTFVITVHVIEVVTMARGSIRKYNVRTGSALWWKWVFGISLEGFACIVRFKEVAKEAEERLKKQKH